MENNPLKQVPVVSLPDPGIYTALGQGGIEALVLAVYKLLAVSPIKAMFPADPAELEKSAVRSALFWVTACGGPPLYEQQVGPPRMRARHLKFTIDETSRRHWLDCWDVVLATAEADFGFPGPLLPSFRVYLESFSQWMVNSP